MLLKLDEFKGVAADVNKELRCLRYLKEQFQLELGYRASGKTLHALAVRVNDVLDERLIIGESDYIPIKTSVLIECLKHPSGEVRRMSARLLPENLADKIIFADEDEFVIYAAANRASPNALASLLEQNRSDELLFDIARDRLNEDVDLERAERLKSVVKSGPSIDIDEFWYKITAKTLIEQYAHPTDGGIWINKIVKSTSSNMKSTSGVEIDEEKLRKEIINQINEDDDETLESVYESNNIFSKMIENLNVDDAMNESFNLNFDFEEDPLFESTTNSDYIKKFESEYKVQYFRIPKAMFVKRGLDESILTQNSVPFPAIAYTPHMKAPTERDEKALDRYVESWTRRMMPKISDTLLLKWSMNPEHEGKVSFNIGIL